MHTAPELSQMYRFSGNKFIHHQFPGLRGTEDGMVVRINSLRDAKICTALPQGFQVTIKAFILCKEEPTICLEASSMAPWRGYFTGSPNHSYGIASIWISCPGWGSVFGGGYSAGFFPFWGFQSLHFLVYWKEQNRKGRFRNLLRVYL